MSDEATWELPERKKRRVGTLVLAYVCYMSKVRSQGTMAYFLISVIHYFATVTHFKTTK